MWRRDEGTQGIGDVFCVARVKLYAAKEQDPRRDDDLLFFLKTLYSPVNRHCC